MRTATCLLLLLGMPGPAHARTRDRPGQHKVLSPSRIDARIENSLIITRTGGRVRGTSTLKSDIRVQFNCPNSRVHKPKLEVVATGTVKRLDKNAFGRLTWRVGHVLLATARELQTRCRQGRLNVAIKLSAQCGPVPTKRFSSKITLPIHIQCAGPPSVPRPVRWSHTCPPGYVVPGTNKRQSQLNHGNPVSCEPG